MINAFSGFLSFSISTCQYPDFRSGEENRWDSLHTVKESHWSGEASMHPLLSDFLVS